MIVAVAALGLAASIHDVRTRRIPNRLTSAGAALGFLMAITGLTTHTASASLAGLVLGVLLMLPGHVFGATGAGDVKLLGAMGAIVGPGPIVRAFLYSAIAGGALAAMYAAGRGRLAATVRGTSRLVTSPAAGGRLVRDARAHNTFPYGPAISIGCLLAALWGR